MAETKAALLDDLLAAAEGDLAVAALVLAMELYPDQGYEQRDLGWFQDSRSGRSQKRCKAGHECAA